MLAKYCVMLYMHILLYCFTLVCYRAPAHGCSL
nr:MAG TPA: hypothetical protein [Caudoviricetes sp.]